MATMKKNEAYSPICLNDPKQRQSSKTCEGMSEDGVQYLERCKMSLRYETSHVTINEKPRFEAILLTCFDPTTADPIDIYRSAHSLNPVAQQ
jgi:hypothetical protein